MRLFQRTADVVSANLHDFVQRFEKPERMLRHSLREMEALVETTTAAVARSIAAERLLAKTRAGEQDEVARWGDRAAAAVAADDDASGPASDRAQNRARADAGPAGPAIGRSGRDECGPAPAA